MTMNTMKKLVYFGANGSTILDVNEIAHFSRLDDAIPPMFRIILKSGQIVQEMFLGNAVKQMDEIEAVIRKNLDLPIIPKTVTVEEETDEQR